MPKLIPMGNGERPLGRLPSIPTSATRWSVEVEVATDSPRLELRAGADRDGLPLARQALRALGLSAGADYDSLHDAELALTEACANAVLHAYPTGSGVIDVSIEVRDGCLRVVVRDQGRGMPERCPPPLPAGGLGLKVIEAIARRVEIRSGPGLGTELTMDLPLQALASADLPPPGSADLESLTRRLLAVGAAQSDLTPTRITEALMAAEIVAREVPAQIIGRTVRLRIERDNGGVALFLGPLPPNGAQDVLAKTDVPVLGPIVERLADAVWEVPPETGRPSDGAELALRFDA
jgi:serine/threonine-protein kinase RsbW